MFEENFLTKSGKIAAALVLELVYFPVWWYSAGLVLRLRRAGEFLRGRNQALGFSVWAKNIFVPMYGQNDFAGRAISLVIRLLQVLVRGLAMLFFVLITVGFLLAWLFLPVFLFLALFFQFLD